MRYLSPDGNAIEQSVPQIFVGLVLKACNNQHILELAEGTETTQQGVLQYRSSFFPFEVKYPETWKVEESVDGVAFISPEDYPFDRYLEEVNIYTIPANSISSVDEAVKDSLSKEKLTLPILHFLS